MSVKYSEMSASELEKLRETLKTEYEKKCAEGLSLDMSRGKPGADQLTLSRGMLGVIDDTSCLAADGTDCRNYGGLCGIAEARAIFAEMLGVPAENIIIGGNSSLNMMYDEMTRAMLFGTPDVGEPWCCRRVKFLCPSPGYDRHFAISESLGMELVLIPMTPDGPDMDAVEAAVTDPDVKGIWCTPKYSNPEGVTYSDETVRRLASMKTAADDFRIFWDNAYAVHCFTEKDSKLLNIYEEAQKSGHANRVLIFASTSKITYPGSGISAFASSEINIAGTKKHLAIQTIGYDKLNMLRHVKFFGSYTGIQRQMRRHAEIIRPKFEMVLDMFERCLAPCGIAEWTKPSGGYFISLNVPDGCAKAVYNLAAAAGVKLTNAGATFPYGRDPRDRNLRIAPTYPSVAELKAACEVLCLCVRYAAVQKLLEGKNNAEG